MRILGRYYATAYKEFDGKRTLKISYNGLIKALEPHGDSDKISLYVGKKFSTILSSSGCTIIYYDKKERMGLIIFRENPTLGDERTDNNVN